METANADAQRLERLRLLIMFVIAWIVGLYVFEVVRDAVNGTLGFVLAAATIALNMYARRQVARTTARTWAVRFWTYLPLILFVVVPVIVKVVSWARDDTARTWWDHLLSLVPFVLKLGVPVVLLLWVYFALGRAKPAPPEAAG